MAVAVMPPLSNSDPALCLDRDHLTGIVVAAQAGLGKLVGSLGGIADAHNAVVTHVHHARQQLDPLVKESSRVLHRLQAVEERCGGLPDELRALIGKDLRSEFVRELGEQARSQKADLQDAVGSQWEALAAFVEKQVAAADDRRQRADDEVETSTGERLRALERTLEKLAMDVRDQGERQQEQRTEQRELVNSTLPRLRSDLVARVEGLGAGLSERADNLATRLQRAEKQASEHAAELEKLRAGLDMRALASKIPPLDARLAKAEEMAASAAKTLAQEVAKLEAQLNGVKTALLEQLQAVGGLARKAAKAEAEELIGAFRSREGKRLSELEGKLQQTAGDLGDLVERMGREINSTHDDIAAGRDWAAKRIEALAETLRQLESARKLDAERNLDLTRQLELARLQLQKQEQDAEKPDGHSQDLDYLRWELDKDALSQQVSDLDHRQCSLDRRQEACDSNMERLEKIVRAIAASAERAASSGDLSGMAGAVTKCIACGHRRGLSPTPRSPSPPPEERIVITPVMASQRMALTERTTGPSGFRSPVSRPTSAGKRGVLEPDGAMPVGSAHSACRAIGPFSPRRPRPGSATFR